MTTTGGFTNTATGTVNASGGAINGTVTNNTGGTFNVGGTVSGNSTFANAGTLTINSGAYTGLGAITNSGAVTTAAGTTLGGASFTQSAGTTTNNGSMSLSSALAVNGGTFSNIAGASVVATTSSTAAGSTVNNAGSWTDPVSNTGTFNQTAGSIGAFTNNAGGTLALSGGTMASLASSGTVNVTGGSITGALAVNGGTVSLSGGANLTAGALSGSGGTVDLGTGRLTAGGNNATTSYSGVLSGGGGRLVKEGTGTMTLTGANTYTGGTTINGGTVAVATDANLGAANGGLRFNGGTLQTTGSFTANRLVELESGGGTFNTATGTTLTLGGSVTEILSPGRLTKTGTGTLVLTGTSTYSGGTLVSGGTLQGNTTSLRGAIANNAAVVFNQSAGGFYAGDMSGTGSLTKSGVGTLVLSGTNSYSGGTTVSAGTLTGTTSSLQGAITNNAFVTFEQTATGTYAGAMSGSGVLSKDGSGDVTLSGVNTYSGGTNVNAGTLRLGAGVSLNSTAGLAVNGPGTFDLNGNNQTVGVLLGAGRITLGSGTLTAGSNIDSTTFSGVISGAGGFVKQGTSNLTLSGANSYSGGTTVSAGTLIGNVISLQGNIVNNAAVVFDQATDGIYAGNMSGTGSLTKQNAGTLTLSGINTYTGATTVTGGKLAINGSFAGSLSIGAGGMLGGTGTVGATTINTGGTIAPGNSIGTLTVNGSFTQNAGVYQVEVNAAGQSDRINVVGAPGTATINGGTVQVLAQAGTYARNTTYTILSATGGRTGTYSNVTSNFAFLTPSLSYDSNNVYLLLLQQSGAFAAGAQTGNQRAVGTVLDQATATATGDFANVLNALATLNTQQGPAALTAISGQQYSGFGSANVSGGIMFMNVLGQQMSLARGGSGGGTRVALAEACDVACDGEPASPWSLWGSALGATGSVAGNNNSATVTYNAGGVSTGFDYRFSPNLLAGIGVGFASGNQWANGFNSRGSTDSYSVSLYGSFTQSAFYLDALAGYAYNDNQMTRQIVIPGLATRTAMGHTGANQLLGQAEAGYKVGIYEPAAASLTPFARFQAMTVNQAAFSETGASSLNLNVAQQTTNSVRTVLGAELAGGIDMGWREKLGLQFRLGWAHEYADTSRPLTASFAGAPTLGYTVYGATPQRDTATVGLAANTAIAEATSVYFRYDGEVGTGIANHVFSAGLRMNW